MDSDLAVMELLDRAAVSYELVLTKTDEHEAGARPRRCWPPLAAEARKHTAALAEIAATSALNRRGNLKQLHEPVWRRWPALG